MKRIITLSLTALLASGSVAGAAYIPQSQKATIQMSAFASLGADTIWKMLCEKYGVPYQPLPGCGTSKPEQKPDEPELPEETPDEPELPEETPDEPELPEETPDEPELPEETPEEPELPDETPDEPELPEETPDEPELPEETPDVPGQKPEQPEEKPDETPDNSVDAGLSAYASEVVRLVNEARAAQGLPALKADAGVSAAAQVRASELRTLFSHTRPNGTSCFTALKEGGVSYRSAGENIAYGQQTPAAVMQAWMNSAGHRANILSKNYTTIGVGYTVVNGVPYWTQFFTA